MKKIIPILTLALGGGIGWSAATYQSHQTFQQMQSLWSPEFKQFIEESYTVGSMMTEEELRQQLESVVEVGKKISSDGNSRTYWQAQQAFLIKKYLENGNTNSVNSSIHSRLGHFVERYDQGDFEDDINEESATKLAEAIKNANQKVNAKISIESGNELGAVSHP